MAAPTPYSIQEYQTGFAEPIRPYAETLLGQAELLTDTELNPYMQYMGDKVAQFTPLQQQAYQNARAMQAAPQLGDATALSGMAGLGQLAGCARPHFGLIACRGRGTVGTHGFWCCRRQIQSCSGCLKKQSSPNGRSH